MVESSSPDALSTRRVCDTSCSASRARLKLRSGSSSKTAMSRSALPSSSIRRTNGVPSMRQLHGTSASKSVRQNRAAWRDLRPEDPFSDLPGLQSDVMIALELPKRRNAPNVAFVLGSLWLAVYTSFSYYLTTVLVN